MLSTFQSFNARRRSANSKMEKVINNENIATLYFFRLESLTVRVLDLYCRHVCLLRPLGEGGKMRVTTDMAQIELALAPFCQKLADLGLPYKKLRLLR